jgi:uncharacterized protein (DUF433 family)
MKPVIKAFTRDQAYRVTGVSPRRMAYWARTDVLQPSIRYSKRGEPYGYVYDFRDVVGLRTLATLRDKHGISLQQLRRANQFLRAHANRPWSELRFWVRDKEIFFSDPVSHELMVPGDPAQAAFQFEMEPVVLDVVARIDTLSRRNREHVGQVERHRHIQGNQEVVKGTRVPVESVLELAGDGYGIREIVEAFPSLTEDDVQILLRDRAA